MRRLLIASSIFLLVAACGSKDDQAGSGGPGPAEESLPRAAPAPGAAPPGAAPADAGPAPAAAPAAAGPVQGLDGRTGELVNPDNNAMVFLYYDLTGIAPPIDRWVEEDSRVKFVPALDKPAARTAVRAELEAGVAAVKGAGVIRLSLNNANLSDYDPTYGEFTVRALSPSSVVAFDALGQKVSIRFGNGKYAQIWRVPPAEAQAVRDRVPLGTNVELDVLLAIKSVVPGPAGGTITADVVEYEMRETRTGTTLARVQMPAS
ncbi:MAG: hypothetical protein OEW72_00220 [Gammaproteobacteria bacterium]|nr:hypothetical protein [Gammaproteobacteria bacterium]